jgi:hypothetical protein
LFAGLFDGLFDDASIFPPGNAPMPDAVRAHADHRAAWYAPTVGPFICPVARLGELAAELTGELGGRLADRAASVDLSLTVPDGIAALQHGISAALDTAGVRLCAVELPLGDFDPDQAAHLLGSFADLRLPIYLEVPVTRLDAELAGAIAASGFRLKLRTGGTTAGAFPGADELAAALVAAARHGLVFKCTAGLHNAVRHRDAHTGFEHHGFLNVLVATAAACTNADAGAVAALLAERDGVVLAGRVRGMHAGARRAFTSFGTCSITEPVEDLRALGLLEAP